jgi:ABC-type branched-subunit amino acid transport system ATPase component
VVEAITSPNASAATAVDVNFRSKSACLIGPNGAGKSTFFGHTTGQYRLDRSNGRVLIRGADVGMRPHEIVRGCGHQDAGAVGDERLTVSDPVARGQTFTAGRVPRRCKG